MAIDQFPPSVILFDGVCNLCNGAVNFIIDRDPKGHFHFTALQQEAGRQILKSFGLDPEKLNTIILYENGELYEKSTAALRIARHLSGLWPACYAFIIVPRFIRDAVYNWIAKNRYKWFGKRETCRMPEPGVKERFLDGL